MKLRSSTALERAEPGLVLGLENIKSPVAKWLSRSKVANEAERLSLRSGQSNCGKTSANESEIGVCIDNADEDIEMGSINDSKTDGLNSDDKFLGSEVLDPIKDLPVSFPEGEIEEESVERVHNGDNGMDNKIIKKKGRGRPRKILNLNKNEIETAHGNEEKHGEFQMENSQISGVIKRKRGRKRKNIEGSKCNEDERAKKKKVAVRVSERVLQLKSTAVTGGTTTVVDGGSRPEKKKKKKNKKKIERRGRPRKIQVVESETRERVLQVKSKAVSGGTTTVVDGGRPEKKIERRGRPRKIQGESKSRERVLQSKSTAVSGGRPEKKMIERRGRPRKSKTRERVLGLRCMAAVTGGGTVVGGGSRPEKKVERRGRPRKIQVKETVSQKKRQKDTIIKKLKMRKLNLMGVENRKKKSKGNNVNEGLKKSECIKLVREKLLDILLKAGWMIDRRPRQERTYKDMVYIEPSGRSHWSITRAYAKLTKKVKDGQADSQEVNAFTTLPDDEISMLFRPVDKELGYKKKKNRKWKDGKRVKEVIKKVITNKRKKKDEKGISVKSRKPGLLARGNEKGTKQENKKRNLLSWMIDSGVISSGWKVKYGKTRKRVYEGVITSDGIVCGCCNESMNVCGFVSHCGGKVGWDFDDVCLESGMSLRKCLLDSWRKEEELNGIRFNFVDKGDDPNDDTCNVCGDGGNLICCDGCPSTFHQNCLDIQNFPPGVWNCIYCSCKFCGVVSEIAPDKPPSEMLSCGLCEEKFHQSCLIEVGDVDMDSNRPPFCGQKCQELFEKLQTYVGVKNELEDGFSWTLLQRCDISQDLTNLKVENNSKLAVAFSVMDECFLPIVDERSGTSIIHNVVYNCGSNFRRLNYAGFLTAVLEKGEELVTAASIRLHGSRLAEMPFIGTRHMYRRQGMCRRLLDAIESTLSSIGVEELIIPAIPALLETWTKVFGFIPLEESKKKEMKFMNMLVFPGIDMLQKPLLLLTNPSPFADSDNPNDQTVSQTTLIDAIDCNEIPVDAAEITKNAIDYEKLETTSSNVVDDDEKPGVEKDAIDYEQMEEDIILMDNYSCPEDKSINSNGYDLNFPVKNVTFGGPDFTIRPCSTESVTCGPDQLSESELHIENDGVKVKESSLTPKNTFDLNLHPTVVDSDMHIVGDDSKSCDTRPLVLL